MILWRSYVQNIKDSSEKNYGTSAEVASYRSLHRTRYRLATAFLVRRSDVKMQLIHKNTIADGPRKNPGQSTTVNIDACKDGRTKRITVIKTTTSPARNREYFALATNPFILARPTKAVVLQFRSSDSESKKGDQQMAQTIKTELESKAGLRSETEVKEIDIENGTGSRIENGIVIGIFHVDEGGDADKT
ncbi:hypothetical protein EVAR_43658_1 [Eumeta japonica]|uniref:Uncharacterized protein n=1 Tax=Eumeta variegata TaxID=151549 RepID=A0A4C1XYU3_EUMVA|nr:hypothetical protein EVAR_43658_1 [Eumeta japonica]